MISVSKDSLDRRKVILLNVGVFICLIGAICALVGYSIWTVTNNSNALDDSRSYSTVRAALSQSRAQIEDLARDNAFWDDAATAAYVNNDVQWMRETWGETPEDFAVYDDVLVLDAQGNAKLAVDDGETIRQPVNGHYDASIVTLLNRIALRTKITTETPVESAFITERDKIVTVGIAPILPINKSIAFDRSKALYIVLVKHFDAESIASMGEIFNIPGLKIEKTEPLTGMFVPINNPDENSIGYITWPQQLPGSTSLSKVTPNLIAALALLLLFLALFGLFTRYLVDGLKRDKQKAQYESTHDALSGLYNRAGLIRKLDRALLNAGMKSPPHANHAVSLVYLDLDGFKEVNDSYGHNVGDSLIRLVAAKLSNLVPDSAKVARLGGDEFAIVLPDDPGCKRATEVATGVHDLFREPFQVEGRCVVVGASIGVANAEPTPATTTDELIRQADLAMYRAKDMGRSRTVLFETGFDEKRSEQLALENDLGAVIVEGDIRVDFQPLVDAKTSQWHGVEALARWHNKRLGRFISPDVFIPLAERTGLIEALGLMVLRKSLVAAKAWPGLKISVNVSPAQFRNPSFPDHVQKILRDTGFDSKMLTLEITEGFFIRQPESAQRIVTRLKGMGISISLDDFGSGYSSIGYLRQFAFDRLKIDRSFVKALDYEANAPSIIHATVALANAFNIPVTAEGVEREEQASILRLTGCDEFQGYLFGKPMSAAEIGRILQDGRASAASAA